MYCISLFFLALLLSLSGGFQGIPSSLRQPGPRANLRHMTPNSGTQGPRGVFTKINQPKWSPSTYWLWIFFYRHYIYSSGCKEIVQILLHFSSSLLASGQGMGPRPSMGVPGPRAMPPYKYATGVRNPNPQVVQPIALQQVWAKDQSHHLVFLSYQCPKPIIIFLPVLFICLFQAQPAVHVQGQEPLTASMLAAAPPQEQKQMLGKNPRIVRS